MRPPVFIVERNGDVTAYPAVQQAERAVESVDVEDGEYSAVYDADGCLLELHVETPTKRRRSWLFPWFETIELTPVRLRPKEGLPSHQAELRAALVEHLRHKGVVVGADLGLDAVIALCV